MSGTTLYESAVCLISSGSKIPHTVVVCANLEGLVSAHNQSCLSVLLVLQESHITGTTLLPLVGLADELEELGAHLEGLLLNFLTGLNVNLLGEMNDWLEVDILGGWGFILFYHQLFGSRCVIDRHFGLADPELSPRSSSSTFSFFAPPPNIEKTESCIVVAAVVAAVVTAAVACSTTVYTYRSQPGTSTCASRRFCARRTAGSRITSQAELTAAASSFFSTGLVSVVKGAATSSLGSSLVSTVLDMISCFYLVIG